jgi:hypothetical protein
VRLAFTGLNSTLLLSYEHIRTALCQSRVDKKAACQPFRGTEASVEDEICLEEDMATAGKAVVLDCVVVVDCTDI